MTGGGEIIIVKRGGGDVSRRYPLVSGSASLGGAMDSDIRVLLPDVAQHHATLTVNKNECIIRNLSPDHTTLVNGEPITTQALKHNDVITLGERSLRWEYFYPPTVSKIPLPSFTIKAKTTRKKRSSGGNRRKTEVGNVKSDADLKVAMELKQRMSLHNTLGQRQVAVVRPQRRSESDQLEVGRSSIRVVTKPHRPYSPPAGRSSATRKSDRRSTSNVFASRKANTPVSNNSLSKKKNTPRAAAVQKIEEPSNIDVNKKAALMLLTGRSPVKNIKTPVRSVHTPKMTPGKKSPLKRITPNPKMLPSKTLTPKATRSTPKSVIARAATPKQITATTKTATATPKTATATPRTATATPKTATATPKPSKATPKPASATPKAVAYAKLATPKSALKKTSPKVWTPVPSTSRRSSKRGLEAESQEDQSLSSTPLPDLPPFSPRKSALKSPNASPKKIASIKFDLPRSPRKSLRSDFIVATAEVHSELKEPSPKKNSPKKVSPKAATPTRKSSRNSSDSNELHLRYSSESPTTVPAEILSRSQKILEKSLGSPIGISPKKSNVVESPSKTAPRTSNRSSDLVKRALENSFDESPAKKLRQSNLETLNSSLAKLVNESKKSVRLSGAGDAPSLQTDLSPKLTATGRRSKSLDLSVKKRNSGGRVTKSTQNSPRKSTRGSLNASRKTVKSNESYSIVDLSSVQSYDNITLSDTSLSGLDSSVDSPNIKVRASRTASTSTPAKRPANKSLLVAATLSSAVKSGKKMPPKNATPKSLRNRSAITIDDSQYTMEDSLALISDTSAQESPAGKSKKTASRSSTNIQSPSPSKDKSLGNSSPRKSVTSPKQSLQMLDSPKSSPSKRISPASRSLSPRKSVKLVSSPNVSLNSPKKARQSQETLLSGSLTTMRKSKSASPGSPKSAAKTQTRNSRSLGTIMVVKSPVQHRDPSIRAIETVHSPEETPKQRASLRKSIKNASPRKSSSPNKSLRQSVTAISPRKTASPKSLTLAVSPKTAKKSITPKSAQKSVTPKSASKTVTPKPAKKTLSPKSVSPKAARKSITPKTTKKTMSPKSVSPKSLEIVVSPKPARKTITPKSAKRTLSPKSARSSLSIKSPNVTTSPKSARKTITPKTAKQSLSPKSTEKSPHLKTARKTMTPKTAKKTMSPKSNISPSPKTRKTRTSKSASPESPNRIKTPATKSSKKMTTTPKSTPKIVSPKRTSKILTPKSTSPKNKLPNRSLNKSTPKLNMSNIANGVITPDNSNSPTDQGTPVLQIEDLLNNTRSPRTPVVRASGRKSTGAIGNRLRKSRGTTPRTEPRLKGVTKAKGTPKANLRSLKKLSQSAASSNNSIASDKTDENAPDTAIDNVVTPKSTIKIQPEHLKEKHSTAKKPVSRKTLIDQLNQSKELVKSLFSSPVKRKLSQSMSQYSFLDEDDMNASLRKRRSTLLRKTPNVSFDLDSLKTPSVPMEMFVSPIGSSRSTRGSTSYVQGVKQLFSKRTPRNDLTNVAGVKALLKTPRTKRSPKNDLSRISGVKSLFDSKQKSPKNDLTNVAGVKKLFNSGKKSAKERTTANDLTNVGGVKKLLQTPGRKQKSPKNDLRSVPNVRSLFSPKNARSPRNALEDLSGVEDLFNVTEKSMSDSLFDQLVGVNPKKYSKAKSFAATKKTPQKKVSSAHSLNLDTLQDNVEDWLESELKKRTSRNDSIVRASKSNAASPKKSAKKTRKRELDNLTIDMVETSVNATPGKRSRRVISIDTTNTCKRRTIDENKLPLKKRSVSKGNNESLPRNIALPIKKRSLLKRSDAIEHSTPVKSRAKRQQTVDLEPVSPITKSPIGTPTKNKSLQVEINRTVTHSNKSNANTPSLVISISRHSVSMHKSTDFSKSISTALTPTLVIKKKSPIARGRKGRKAPQKKTAEEKLTKATRGKKTEDNVESVAEPKKGRRGAAKKVASPEAKKTTSPEVKKTTPEAKKATTRGRKANVKSSPSKDGSLPATPARGRRGATKKAQSPAKKTESPVKSPEKAPETPKKGRRTAKTKKIQSPQPDTTEKEPMTKGKRGATAKAKSPSQSPTKVDEAPTRRRRGKNAGKKIETPEKNADSSSNTEAVPVKGRRGAKKVAASPDKASPVKGGRKQASKVATTPVKSPVKTRRGRKVVSPEKKDDDKKTVTFSEASTAQEKPARGKRKTPSVDSSPKPTAAAGSKRSKRGQKSEDVSPAKQAKKTSAAPSSPAKRVTRRRN